MRSFLFYHYNFCLRKTLASISFQKPCKSICGAAEALWPSVTQMQELFIHTFPFICLVFLLVHVSLKVNKNLSECDKSQDLNLPVPRRRVSVKGGREHSVLGLVTQSCPTLCDPVDCSPPGSSVHGIFQAKMLKPVSMPSSRDLPDPGIKSKSPTLQADSLLSEPPGKPSTEGEGKKTPFLLFQDRRSFKISDYIVLHVWPSKCPLDGKKN